MLPAAFSGPQRYWLLALFSLWAALLFGGFLFGSLDAGRSRRMPAWTRLGSSLMLVLAGWSFFAFSAGRASPYPLLIATGMTLGLVGDLFMARWLPTPNRVLFGMAAFGLGHVAYIGAILAYTAGAGLSPLWGVWLAWLAIAAVLWYLVVWRGSNASRLHWLALPYALLLASTAGFATGLALQAPAFLPLAAGSVLFLISDLILATHLFNHAHFYLIDDVVWLTYGPAQMLIVSSIARAIG